MAGQFRHGYGREITVLDAEGKGLGHKDLYAQNVGPRDGKQRGSTSGVGGHEATDIDKAAGDDAIERYGDLLNLGQLFKPSYCGLLPQYIRLRDRDVRCAGVGR